MARRRLLALALTALVAACGGGDGGVPAAPDERHGFPSVPRSADAVKVWAIGDGANGSASSRALAEMVARDEPDLVLYTGDVYDQGTAEEFETNVRSPYGPLLERMLPTPGNHDWPNRAQGYDPFWESVTGKPTPHYYAVRAGGWDILSLNSEGEVAPGDAQTRWVERQTRQGGTCRLAFWHRPRFSAGSHGDQESSDPLWIAVRDRVALVVNGHEHNLQRFPLYQGVVQLISGAGGKDHYEVDDADTRPAFTDDDVDGGVRLTLRRDSAAYEFVAVDGRVLDAGRVPCDAL